MTAEVNGLKLSAVLIFSGAGLMASRQRKQQAHETVPEPTPRAKGPQLWTNQSRPYVLEVDPTTGAVRGVRQKVAGEPTFRLRRIVPNQDSGFRLEPIMAGMPAHKVPGMPIWEEPDFDPSWSEPVVSEVEKGVQVIDPYVDLYDDAGRLRAFAFPSIGR